MLFAIDTTGKGNTIRGEGRGISAEVETTDTVKFLADLSLPPASDQVAKVLEVYEAVMKVYAASALQYQAAIQAASPVNGFASSTNQ